MLKLKKKKLCHLRFILDLSFSISSAHKVKNLEGKSSSQKVRQLWVLSKRFSNQVSKYHYVSSSTIYTSAGTFAAHLIFTRTLRARFDSLHITEKTQALENLVLCSIYLTEQPKWPRTAASCQRTLNYCVFHRSTSGGCYMEIMQKLHFFFLLQSL